ncbi:MAG: hypothetical protein ACK5KO_06860 [Arachnia sp.]
MDDSRSPADAVTDDKFDLEDLRRIVVVGLIGLAMVLIVGMILSALLPRWWAQSLGDLINGRIGFGFGLGAAVGLVSMLGALLLLWWAVLNRERLWLGIGLGVLGLICALPNLMTLWVALGTGSAAHAGQRILDVDGPGFRSGSVTGTILGGIIFLIIGYITWTHGKGRSKKVAR